MDEVCVGELGGRSVREEVLLKVHVGVSEASGEVVW